MALADESEFDSERLPNLELADALYQLLGGYEQSASKEKLLTAIQSNNMAPYYKHVCSALQWPLDDSLLAKMEAANAETLAQLDEKIRDAEENLGSTEVRDALVARAEHFCRIGDKANALTAYKTALDKTVGMGQRLDLVFTEIRLGYFWNDLEAVRRGIDKAKVMVEEGGDWERRNRLKVYEGMYLMAVRKFAPAAKLLLDTLSTFTSYELCTYRHFVRCCVLLSLVALDRPTLRKKVVYAPEILTVIHDIPHLQSLLDSLYHCRYLEFLPALAEAAELSKQDRLLGPHVSYMTRELRVVVYAQYLESYRSVEVGAMAAAFGVTPVFLDRELSRFIASGRLNCKIDKVAGVVETTRPDAKNAQYHECIKEGDLLLNRIHKLSRVINL